MNYRRGLDRLFVVFAICWYIGTGLLLWPKWDRALNAQRYAEHIRTNSANADGTHTVFEDEIADVAKPTESTWKITPMRFLAWSSAEQQAKVLRPIKETVFCVALPLGAYLMALAVGWIAGGFKPSTRG